MKITKYLIILILPLFIFSQDKNDRKERYERMQSRKIAFMSNKVELSPDQAQVFWPIYNKYNSEIRSIRDSSKNIMRKYKNNKSSMNNDELGQVIDVMLKTEQRYLEIKIKYVKEFYNIISNRQMIELYDAEEAFKKDLLKRIKKGNSKKPSNQPSPPPTSDKLPKD